MSRMRFRDYNPDQQLLLPQDMRKWLGEGHLASFIMDLVKELDLTDIYDSYDGSKGGNFNGYCPEMMVALLLYSYCVGVTSSRKISKNTEESVPFRVISADSHPAHNAIAEFRQRHLKDLSKLFVQVLKLCQKAGLVKLGHVSLDGTKVKANASKRKAMSYERMLKKEEVLEKEIQKILEAAESADNAEDELYGKDKRGDELPEELQFRQKRLETIRKAKKELEEEAKDKASDEDNDEDGKVEVDPKAQKNFTDPESKIMKSGSSFEQCYNAQACVDEKNQIIVASNVTQQGNDYQQLEPMVKEMKSNLGGEKPKKFSADNGYLSESNLEYLEHENIDSYIATGKEKGVKEEGKKKGRIPKSANLKERMRRKLKTKKGSNVYKRRKSIVEPVFGQVKEERGFRRFSFRGFENVGFEWDIVCLSHNLLKLFRSGKAKLAIG